RGPRSAREIWSTVTSIPLAVPQSLAYLSNHTSYDGTKWLHWRILSVFWGRLSQMVGPSATAAAAPVVVVTNSRRSIRFCFVIDLPPLARKTWSGLGTPGRRPGGRRGSIASGRLSPGRCPGVGDTSHLSKRVQHAESDLVGARARGVAAGHRPAPFRPERVPPCPAPQ